MKPLGSSQKIPGQQKVLHVLKAALILAASMTLFTQTYAMGGWNGSGGGGAVCFATAELADRFYDVQDLSSYESIISIYVLEHAVAGGRGLSLMKSLPSETSASYLQRWLDTVIRPSSTSLAIMLERALRATAPATWLSKGRLPFIRDTGFTIGTRGEVAGWPAECRYVQLVHRYSQERTGQMPQVVLQVDSHLMNTMKSRLSKDLYIQNEALLAMHEAAYFLSLQIAHRDSASLRNLLVELFSEEFCQQVLNAKRNEEKAALLAKRIHKYGLDQFHLFNHGGEEILLKTGAPVVSWQEPLRHVGSVVYKRLVPVARSYEVENIYALPIFAQGFEKIATALRSSGSAEVFYYMGHLTALTHNKYSLVRFEDLFSDDLLSAEQTFEMFCHSLEMDLRTANVDKVLGRESKAKVDLIQRAQAYCHENGFTFKPEVYKRLLLQR